MKVVILAGGLGTRLAEETEIRPKPMVFIGDRPIIWHIMKGYHHHGLQEFVVALGYKGEVLKRYFAEYRQLSASITVDLAKGSIDTWGPCPESWRVHLMDTGLETNTGGRVRRLRTLLGGERFLLTYGDGVGDVDIGALLACHRACGKIATVTAVRPPARFGGLVLHGHDVRRFTEKPQTGEGWINGGFFVFEPAIFDYLDSDGTSLEAGALERLAADGQLAAYRHGGFWQCMDTLRDKWLLERLWASGQAPWRCWGPGRGGGTLAEIGVAS